MNRPRSIIRPRPYGSSRRVPRSRPEAAAELVRVEYERDRLLREIEQLGARKLAASSTLRKLECRARLLHAKLDSAQSTTRHGGLAASRSANSPRRRGS